MNKNILIAAIAASTLSVSADSFICQGFLGEQIYVDSEPVNAGLIYGLYRGAAWNGYCLDPKVPLYIGVTYEMDIHSTPFFLDNAQTAAVKYLLDLPPTNSVGYAEIQAAIWWEVGYTPTLDTAFDTAYLNLVIAAQQGGTDSLFGILHCDTVQTQDLTWTPEPSSYAMFAGLGLVAFGVWRKM